MPITAIIDEATLTPTLEVSKKPDDVVEDKAIWQMAEQALLDHPELSERLRDAQFQYLGVVETKAKKKSDPSVRTLLYTRPDPEALLSQEERDALPVKEPATGDEREGEPGGDPEEGGGGVQPEDDELPEPPGEGEAETPAPEDPEEVTAAEKGG